MVDFRRILVLLLFVCFTNVTWAASNRSIAVSVCDLRANPETYIGKRVRLTATFVIESHSSYLSGGGCKGLGFRVSESVLPVDREALARFKSLLDELAPEAHCLGCRRYRVTATVAGTVIRSSNHDATFGDHRYGVEINKVGGVRYEEIKYARAPQ